MPRIRANAAPSRNAGNGRTRRRMRGKAQRRNQPSADPKPFVFRPWYHFVVEMIVSVSDSNWHAVDVVPLKNAVKAQLGLGDISIDLRTRNVSGWILNETFTGTLGLATSAVLSDKDVFMNENSSNNLPSFPVSFQNVIEDRPAKNHWARARLGWPGAQQKLAWKDSVVGTFAASTTSMAVPVFYVYIDPQAGANNVTIRVTGWWRPHQSSTSPTSLSLDPRPTVATTRRKVNIKGMPPLPPATTATGEELLDRLETKKPVIKKFKAATPKVSPTSSVVSSTKSDKRTARSQAFKKWKDTKSEISSLSPSDSVSQVDFRDFKDQIMKILTDFKREVSSAQAGEKKAKREIDIVKSQTIPTPVQPRRGRESVFKKLSAFKQAPPEVRKGCGVNAALPDKWVIATCDGCGQQHDDFVPLGAPCGSKGSITCYCVNTNREVIQNDDRTVLCASCEKK